MASDKLMNHTQGETIITKLTSIADSLDDLAAVTPAKLGMGIATCDTAASTTAKTAALANFALVEGAPVSVQFTYANTATNATLNINNTGAKPIIYKDTAIGNDVISAGDTCTFIYTTNTYKITNIDTLTGPGSGTVRQVGAENGLITDQNGNADIQTTGNIGLNLKSTTAFSTEVGAHNTSTDNMYPVALDSEGHPVAAVPTMSASGSGHKGGLVPDPGSTAGTKKYLAENGEWKAPDSAWPSTPTDNTIPSSKLVKDSLDAKVAGPGSSTQNNIATYSDTSGKTVKDSGVHVVNYATGADTSKDDEVPTSKAVNKMITDKGYVVGPSSVTGDTIALFDSTTGKLIKSSSKTFDSSAISNDANKVPTSKLVYEGLGGKVPTSRTINDKELSNNVTLSGDDLKLTNYSKTTSKDSLAATDKVNQAFDKLENRIVANQTNILYSLQTGVKNLFNPEASGNWQYGLSSYSADAKTGTISMATTASDWARTSVPITLPAGEYKFCGNVTALVGSAVITGNTSSSGQETAIFNNIELSTTGTFEISFTLNTETPFWIAVYANFSSSIVSNSVTITGMMICTKAAWDQEPNVYRPFARPNYDLTVREAEDRNALAEVVDNGAKNKLDLSKATITVGSGLTLTRDGDAYVVNGTLSEQSQIVFTNFPPVAGDNLILSGCPSNGSTAGYGIWAYNGLTRVIIDDGSDIKTPYSGEITQIKFTFAAGNYSNIRFYPMICTEADWKISQNFVPYALPNTDLTRMVNDLQKKAVKVYTYHVNPNESDPEDAVTYLDDATGLTPAKMGASSFSYGSWANAWFLPRPCMLKSDGTVAYYLNPNDYSKKTDGTASDIADANFDGNVMLEFPKIWVKRVNDGNGARTVSIAPVNVDGTYKCWSNINAEDKEIDHFYLPAYNGTIHSSKMRSLSGVTLNATYAPNYTRAQEVTAATANNPTGKNMWYTETWADFCLVYDLLYLMGKSLDLQRTFGQGLSSGSETAMRAYVTGTHDAKGLFYGDISGTSTAVKVLGMENLWGCRWHGVAGLINDNGTLKVKMTYGVADGSTVVGYNTTGSGYLNYGSTYGTSGFVKKMQADNVMGYKIIETAGTDATYYCDYYYTNNSQSNYALLGGSSGYGADCGFYVYLSAEAVYADWNIGGSLSCRP